MPLSRPDGTLHKAVKSKLLEEIEKEAESVKSIPHSQEKIAWVIDGMALIQMVKAGNATTFGELSDILFGIILNTFRKPSVKRVDVVFDRYDIEDSIKSFERVGRGSEASIEVRIYGRQVKLPNQWQKFIKNPKNKANLVAFLSREWNSIGKLPYPDQLLVLGGGFANKKQTFGSTNTSAIEIEDLRCDHEEADTRMILHCRHVVLSSEIENVVVWSPDTDVAILLAHHFEDLRCTQLWFRTGVADKARFIPIHQICSNLGKEICRILVGFHALTGCDSTSGFARIGKVKAFKVLKKSSSSYYGLKTLGDDINISEESIYNLQQFVCHLYMQTYKDSDIDNLRYKLFCQKRAKNESLPPTADSLLHHIKRANYQSLIWRKALVAEQMLDSPTGNGWEHDKEGNLVPVLMNKPTAPNAILEFVTCKCSKSSCRKNCSCAKQELPCTEACLCLGDDDCENEYKDVEMDENGEDKSGGDSESSDEN